MLTGQETMPSYRLVHVERKETSVNADYHREQPIIGKKEEERKGWRLARPTG
jgi:hypothetical protein